MSGDVHLQHWTCDIYKCDVFSFGSKPSVPMPGGRLLLFEDSSNFSLSVLESFLVLMANM